MAKTMSYSFYCSKCHFDHAGECVVQVQVEVDTVSPERTSKLLDEIRELVKLLDGGSYNAKPTKLHQCRQDGACGVPGCDPSVPDPGVVTVSYTLKMRTPLKFIPITFNIYRTTKENSQWEG
jgi:hypothetical protein